MVPFYKYQTTAQQNQIKFVWIQESIVESDQMWIFIILEVELQNIVFSNYECNVKWWNIYTTRSHNVSQKYWDHPIDCTLTWSVGLPSEWDLHITVFGDTVKQKCKTISNNLTNLVSL